jgi:hypothetical protein
MQALQANGFEVARHGRLETPRRHRLVLPHQAQRRVNGAAANGGRAVNAS